MNGLEGFGEAVTGGMAARAVEPHAGEEHGPAAACLNCGTRLTGEFCDRCGQQGHVHRTLGAFWHDVAHSVLHFEGKIWRTLPLLAWRPGELTRRYIAGERARFVSPMALFLFSVFLMFAVLSATGATLIGADDTKEINAGVAADLKKVNETVAELEARRDLAVSKGGSSAQLDKELKEARSTRDTIALGQKYLGGGDQPIGVGEWKVGWDRLDKGIAKANSNPSLLFYKLQTNAYKFSWALIPISVPFIWFLFLHRRRYWAHGAYDHVVFVTYSIGFMSLLFILLLIASALGVSDGWLVMIGSFIPPLHMYRQLKGAYRLSRWSALWRTFALLIFVSITTTLFFLLLLALGVLG